MNKYYIYKYVQNNEVIYIGQSINLVNRIAQHKTDKLKDVQADIYFFECENQTAMNSWEYCLINKYHPKYNVALNNSNAEINITEPKWILYKPDLFKYNYQSSKHQTDNKLHKVYSLNLDVLNITSPNYLSVITSYNFYNTQMLEQRLMLYLLLKSKFNNQDILTVIGSVIEYTNFLNIGHCNIYNQIRGIVQNSDYLCEKTNTSFGLTEKGVEQLKFFMELDIETLISIIQNFQSKYSCFILNLLLQTENYTLSLEELYPYLPPSYTKLDHLKKRVFIPAIEDLKLAGFDFKCNLKKTGRKYTHISFI